MNIQTVLAFDLGMARTGLAIGNTLTRSARGLKVLHAKNKADRLAAAQTAIKEWQPNCLVLGLPCYPDGKPHDMTRAAMNFAKALATISDLPVYLVDERYSSAIAGVETDADAAAVILQHYFDEGGQLFTPPISTTESTQTVIPPTLVLT
jgi:putative holliday junction resolvase